MFSTTHCDFGAHVSHGKSILTCGVFIVSNDIDTWNAWTTRIKEGEPSTVSNMAVGTTVRDHQVFQSVFEIVKEVKRSSNDGYLV